MTPSDRPSAGECVTPGIEGAHFLNITFGADSAPTPTGLGADIPHRVAIPDTTFVTEVVIACSFEGQANAVIGLGEQRPFEAYELGAPARLVIEVR